MKTRHILMALSVASTAGLAVFGDKTPSSAITEAAPHSASPFNSATAAAHNTKARPGTAILALQRRADLLGGDAQHKSNAVLFDTQSWTPQPLAPSTSGPPARPTAPPLPFEYLGKKSEDGTWEVYLAHGEETLIVHEKSVIDGAYRVTAIKPPTMTLTYLPLKQVQTLTIGSTD
ncbi:MAG: hypothetical protein JWP38_493 [Herbaspirillum sp.]|jgi:hypothetical protein|nr:hypothetical protein [Herbaspirillum sp.]